MAGPQPTPPARRTRRRRRQAIVLGVCGVVLAAWALAVWTILNEARDDTQAGIDKLEEARDVITPTGLVRGEGIDLLRAAEADFARARRRVRSPWVAPLRVLPVVGRQLRSVDALTGAARLVVDLGVEAIEDARAELEGGRQAGPERVELVQRLGDVAEQAGRSLDEVDLGPGEALIGPLRDARSRFADELSDLRDAVTRVEDSSRGFADFLEGPSVYLVLAANNNEMRFGSGTFLSAGILTVRDGSFEVSDITPTREYQLPEGAVTLEGDLADRWGWLEPEREWRNLASSPVFDTQAELASRMWASATGMEVDGVLALDPVALQAVLAATGPVAVEGATYDADNVLEQVYLRQYDGIVGYPGVEQERRDRLSAIAGAAIGNLEEGDWETVDLVEELRHAAGGRHVLAWSSEAAQQQGWEAARLNGVLEDESLMIGVHNRGANKLDQFLGVRARIAVEDRAGGGTEVAVEVALTNRSPEGLPQYVAGPYPEAAGAREGLYQGLLVAELPSGAQDMYVTDEQGRRLKLIAAGADGDLWVVGAYVEVERGASRTLTVHFGLAPGWTRLRVEPSARVPSIEWSGPGGEWTDEAAHHVEW